MPEQSMGDIAKANGVRRNTWVELEKQANGGFSTPMLIFEAIKKIEDCLDDIQDLKTRVTNLERRP